MSITFSVGLSRRHALVSVAAALTVTSTSGFANTAAPLRIIVSFPPGGASDQLGRALAQKLTEQKGYPVLVENRPGGGSQIAASALKQLPPDGTSLFLGDIGAFSLNRHLYRKLSYDADRDFAPVALLAKAPLLLVVPASSEARSVADLVSLAKRKPQGLSYASPGAGTGAHIAAEIFRQRTGIRLTHVPYRGAGPALVDLAGGQVDLLFDPLVSNSPFLKDGKTRALAIASPSRSPSAPNVPTLSELGIDGVNFVAWWGIVALAKTAAPRIAELNAEINTATRSEDVVKRFQDLGFELATLSAEAFGTLIKSDAATYADVIRSIGVSLD